MARLGIDRQRRLEPIRADKAAQALTARGFYRGKRLDNGEWAYGFLAFVYTEGRNEKGLVFTDKARIYSPEDCRSYNVDAKTVGQYTGLKDPRKRGCIFEGDVMRFVTEFGETLTSEVAFMDGYFYVQGEAEDDIYTIIHTLECMDAQVIGNIHDNPELLKGGEK